MSPEQIILKPGKAKLLGKLRNRVRTHSQLAHHQVEVDGTIKTISEYSPCQRCKLHKLDMWLESEMINTSYAETYPCPDFTVGNCYAILDHVYTNRVSFDVIDEIPVTILLRVISAIGVKCLALSNIP